MQTLKQANAQTQSDLDKVTTSQDRQSSILDQNTPDLPQLTLFIEGKSNQGMHDYRLDSQAFHDTNDECSSNHGNTMFPRIMNSNQCSMIN